MPGALYPRRRVATLGGHDDRAVGLAAGTLTEVDPTHDPTRALVEAYLDAVVAALAG